MTDPAIHAHAALEAIILGYHVSDETHLHHRSTQHDSQTQEY